MIYYVIFIVYQGFKALIYCMPEDYVFNTPPLIIMDAHPYNHLFMSYKLQGHISSRVSSNSEAKTSYIRSEKRFVHSVQ